jgi:hypothetical protein
MLSTLVVLRCDGAHLLVEETDEPVGFDKRSMPMLDWELLLDSELPRDIVRSKSRVWYANWPVWPDLEGESEGIEAVGSMVCQFINRRQS